MTNGTVGVQEYIEYEEGGFKCVIRRMGYNTKGFNTKLMGAPSWYCGYVGVPEGHWAFKETAMDRIGRISVYGSVTYCDYLPESNTSLWFIGFDCNHGDDQSNPKDEAFVRREISRMVLQLQQSYTEAVSREYAGYSIEDRIVAGISYLNENRYTEEDITNISLFMEGLLVFIDADNSKDGVTGVWIWGNGYTGEVAVDEVDETKIRFYSHSGFVMPVTLQWKRREN